MVALFIAAAPEELEGRNREDDEPSRLRHPVDLADSADIILHVFQDVNAYDQVKQIITVGHVRRFRHTDGVYTPFAAIL